MTLDESLKYLLRRAKERGHSFRSIEDAIGKTPCHIASYARLPHQSMRLSTVQLVLVELGRRGLLDEAPAALREWAEQQAEETSHV